MDIFARSHFDRLPLELKIYIFQQLCFKELGVAMMVCRDWRRIIEDPFNWRKLQPRSIYPDQVEALLSVPRLCQLEAINIRHDPGEMLEVQGVSQVEGAPKFKVLQVRRMETEHLRSLTLDRLGQMSALADLNLSQCNLLNVDADLLSDVINNMTKVTLVATLVTGPQLESILSKMAAFTNIKTLEIGLNSSDAAKHIENYKVIGEGLNKVKNLTVHEMSKQFLVDQVAYFFQKMEEETDIEGLELVNSKFIAFPDTILASSLNNIQQLRLSSVTISEDQIKQFFKSMKSNSRLQKLIIEGKVSNVHTVDPKVFSSAVVKIPNLDMSYTNLTNDQLTQFFTEAWRRKSHFESLNLTANNLSQLPGNILAKVVGNNIKVCCFRSSQVTLDQVEAIAKESLDYIHDLDLSENNFETSVPRTVSLLVNKIPKVDLSQCKLNGHSLNQIFKDLLDPSVNTRTLKLTVLHNACNEVSKELIAKAERKLCVTIYKKKTKSKANSMCLKCGKGPFVKLKLHKCKIEQ